MSPNNRDILLVEHILKYCNEISETVQAFGNLLEIFEQNFIYRNACAMCILQIGELAGLLSEDFRSKYSDIQWRNIKGMRNIFAHKYGSISISTTWETITEDIPLLKKYCEDILDDVK